MCPGFEERYTHQLQSEPHAIAHIESSQNIYEEVEVFRLFRCKGKVIALDGSVSRGM